jgi:hypothetical protein
MLPLVQICIVVVTLAVVAIAVATVRAMLRAERATARFARLTCEVRRWVVEASELTRETRDTVVLARGVIAPVSRIAERFETLGVRTADLSVSLLEEVETPLLTAAAVARGLGSVTAHLLQRLSHRFTDGRSATNGRSDHE